MHLVSPRPLAGKMYEVKRKGETGTGFYEISPDLMMGTIHVTPTILVILLVKVYMSTSNVSYVSTTLMFVTSVVIFHFSRFKSKIIQLKKSVIHFFLCIQQIS